MVALLLLLTLSTVSGAVEKASPEVFFPPELTDYGHDLGLTTDDDELPYDLPESEERGRCFGAKAKCSTISCATSSKCLAMGCTSCR